MESCKQNIRSCVCLQTSICQAASFIFESEGNYWRTVASLRQVLIGLACLQYGQYEFVVSLFFFPLSQQAKLHDDYLKQG